MERNLYARKKASTDRALPYARPSLLLDGLLLGFGIGFIGAFLMFAR